MHFDLNLWGAEGGPTKVGRTCDADDMSGPSVIVNYQSMRTVTIEPGDIFNILGRRHAFDVPSTDENIIILQPIQICTDCKGEYITSCDGPATHEGTCLDCYWCKGCGGHPDGCGGKCHPDNDA